MWLLRNFLTLVFMFSLVFLAACDGTKTTPGTDALTDLVTGARSAKDAFRDFFDSIAEQITRAEGKPLAVPSALYLLNLPAAAALATDDRLRAFYDQIAQTAIKTSANRVAKGHADDAAKMPLLADPVALLLATMRTAKKETGWRRMASFAQALIVGIGKKKAEALKAAGRTSDANKVLHVFDKRTFTPDALQSALSSAEAAKALFPAIPATFWPDFIGALVKAAPNMKRAQIVTDDAGNPMKDADGKTIREEVSAPVSPAFLLAWLETRNETPFTRPADITLDLSDLMA